MLELVEPGEEKTKLFAMLFLRRLPPAVRVQLTEDDHTDLRAMAEKADRCAASLARHADSSLVASVEDSSEDLSGFSLDVAAVGLPGNNRQWKKPKDMPFQGPKPAAKKKGEAPCDMARVATGLCYYHFMFGGKANSCRQPCNWQPGN